VIGANGAKDPNLKAILAGKVIAWNDDIVECGARFCTTQTSCRRQCGVIQSFQMDALTALSDLTDAECSIIAPLLPGRSHHAPSHTGHARIPTATVLDRESGQLP
jgi:hypothetical protein